MKSKNAASFPEETSTDEEELTEGWEIKKLKDITSKVPTLKPESEPERIFGYVDISSINNDTNQIVEFKKIRGEDAPSRARQSIQPNDVLFSNVRTYLRNIAIVPDDLDVQVCSTGFTVLRSNGSIDPKFLFYYTLTNDFINGVTPQQTGSQYPATTDRVVKDATIPLPPLAEQQRIVARIEALLSHVDAARERLSRVPLIMKKFRQAVLAAACSGGVTEGWREHPTHLENGEVFLQELLKERKFWWEKENQQKKLRYQEPLTVESIEDFNSDSIPDNWSLATIDSISKKVVDGVHKKPNYQFSGIPFLTVKNLTKGPGIDFTDVKYISDEEHEEFIKRSHPEYNDLLITKDGTIGTVRVIKTHIDFSIFVSLSMIKPIRQEMSDFLQIALSSPQIQKRMVKTGSGLQHLVIRDLKSLVIPLPPLAEQNEIVRRVGLLFERADAFDQEVVAASRRCERLTQAVLGKAFRGELVGSDDAKL